MSEEYIEKEGNVMRVDSTILSAFLRAEREIKPREYRLYQSHFGIKEFKNAPCEKLFFLSFFSEDYEYTLELLVVRRK